MFISWVRYARFRGAPIVVATWIAAAVFSATVFVDRAEAQFFIDHGGASSVTIVDGYFGTSNFTAGVVAPFPLGWGGGPFPAYGGYHGGWSGGLGYGAWSGGFGYGGFGYGGGPWYGGGFFAPPLVIPAETMYGPGPVRRMMGLDPPLGTPIVNQTTIVNAPVVAAKPNGNRGFGVLAQGGNAPGRPNVVASNAQTRQRAGKFIDAGDVQFQQQKLAEAFASYKDATRAAPDLADAHFRLAVAAIALQRYDDAVAALKFGLRLSPAWVDSKFQFAALYGHADLASRAHFDALTRAANDRPTADLLFLLGVATYFDAVPQQSRPAFQRARALAVGDTWHIELFLKALERMPAAVPNGAVGPNGAAAPNAGAGPVPVDAAKPVLPLLPNEAPGLGREVEGGVGDDGARDI